MIQWIKNTVEEWVDTFKDVDNPIQGYTIGVFLGLIIIGCGLGLAAIVGVLFYLIAVELGWWAVPVIGVIVIFIVTVTGLADRLWKRIKKRK